jgi:hypothetical protein
MFNLNRDNRETWAGSLSLGFTILLTSIIFFSGYFYMKNIPITKIDKKSLVQQYKNIVQKQFATTETFVNKVDMVRVLEDTERLTRATNSILKQVKYDKKNFLVEVKTIQTKAFIAMLPKNTRIKYEDSTKGIVQYYYEKI